MAGAIPAIFVSAPMRFLPFEHSLSRLRGGVREGAFTQSNSVKS